MAKTSRRREKRARPESGRSAGGGGSSEVKAFGHLDELELETARGMRVVACRRERITLDARGRLVLDARWSWLNALWLGWRPWRRSLGRVAALTYRSARFLDPRGMGFLNRRGGELARRWGAPAYRHEFADARLEMGWGGQLRIAGRFSVGRLALGGIGMIDG